MKEVVLLSRTSEVAVPVEVPPATGFDGGFDAYVRSHGARLGRAAYLLTGDRHLAEDLLQTALAKVAVRWDRVAARGDPTPYVRTVLVRQAIAWRRRRWHGEVPTVPLPDGRRTEDPAADVGAEQREPLRRALLQVPPRQRAALVLRFYEDLSEADAARVLGCSVGTVKSQTAKGLARLRTLLADDTVPPIPMEADHDES